MSDKKKVIIRRFDGVYCLVLVRKNPANPAHWIFEVTVTPALAPFEAIVSPAVVGRCDYVFKRYASGNYYWLDTFWDVGYRTCIKNWFPSWDFRRICNAVDSEVVE